MSEPVVPDPSLARRNLIRGGALVLGAAGAAVAVEALSAGKAHAANGDPIAAGNPNTATSKTTLTMNSGSAATLELTNASGPALKLTPTTAAPSMMTAGDVISRANGPEIVVDYGDGPELTYLATGFDLPPSTIAFEPIRVMDTRSAGLRAQVVRASSSSWFDSSKRVKAGAWIDVAIAGDIFDLYGAYLNVTAIGAPARGNLTVYPASGAPTPSASNLNYPATTSIANLCFVAPALVGDEWCVRVKVNVAATHVILDFSGLVGFLPTAAPATGRTSANTLRLKQTGQRGAAVRSRIVKGLKLNE